jgi:bifunctional non-homologous end joining protein LigD
MPGRWSTTQKRERPVANDPPGIMPTIIEPELATLASRPPASGDWSYEIKYDGYRMLIRIDGGSVRLFTRNGHDWTDRMPKLRAAVESLPVENAWLDGEAVVLNASGTPDFNALQNAFDRRSTTKIVIFLFDILWLNGEDLRSEPLRARRQLLHDLLDEVHDPLIRYSADFAEDPQSLVASACKMNLEGIIGKRGDAPYRSGRSANWVKLKCNLRQEFVIAGISRTKGAKSGVRSLLLGVYDASGVLHYAGNVAPSVKASRNDAISKRIEPLKQKKATFVVAPEPDQDRDYVWLKPELVCEVSFLEWTPSGEIRHAVFYAMREDKPARAVVREQGAVIPGEEEALDDKKSSRERAGPRGAVVIANIKVTNPARVVDSTSGKTKVELARYYDDISEWALPYLHNRPLTLVRAPDGINGELFFQKHSERVRIPGVEELPVDLHPRHPPLLVANNAESLVGLAQMSVVELHSWNAVAPDLIHPDRVIFDLDPDPSLPWSAMIDAASLTKLVLDEIGLTSFAKTSGGKGFHIVVPLTRQQGWADVKGFSQALAQHMAKVLPDHFSAVSGPRNRVGKIFIDYLRNSRGASTVAPFSVRARPGLAVSMPIAWDELKDVTGGDQWSMSSALARQRSLNNDPWEGYWRTRQGITVAMRRAIGMQR